tara:strand:- start:2196 stop:2801 length:606 start_codon:yes stop_codon:yes gene_type:complete
MRLFKLGIWPIAYWFSKSVIRFGAQQIVRKRFVHRTISHPDVHMITSDTDRDMINKVYDVAEKVSIAEQSLTSEKMMKNMLIKTEHVRMITKNTSPSIFKQIYSLGKSHFMQNDGKPIWRKLFIDAIVASHLIPCIGPETTSDILNSICDIVEHTVTPEMAARNLFSKLLASHVDIPIFNEKTEVVVFDSLYNIASTQLFS